MRSWAQGLASIWKIARRELHLIWFDARVRSVVFFAPFLYSALFVAVYSKHTIDELPIALVQEDFSGPARQLVRMLESSQKLKIAERAFSMAELKDIIYRREVVAGIVIPKDFSRSLKRGEDVRVSAFVNASSMVNANTAMKAINEVVQTFSVGIELRTLMKKGEGREASWRRAMPVKLDLHPLFNPAFSYAHFMVPGLLMTVLQQVILLGMALVWTGEKERGSLKELFKISSNPGVLFVGKVLPYAVINTLIAEFFLRVLFPLGDIPMQGSWQIAIPYTLLFVLTIITWGMWFSLVFRTRLFATQALMFVAMPSFVLSGFTWPVEAMPTLAQWMGKLLPMTYFVNSFRAIYLMDVPFEYLRRDFFALCSFLAVNIALSYILILRSVRSELKSKPSA